MRHLQNLTFCLALLLALAACSTPSETSTAPPPSESGAIPSSTSSSQPVQDYFVEKIEDNGIEDREAVDALYCYLYENLTPAQYNTISSSYANYDTTYIVHIVAPNKAPIEKLLNAYSGPWAPVYYESCRFSEAERNRAEVDLRRFLKADREMEKAVNWVDKVGFEDFIVVTVKSHPEKLTAFFENYPEKDIFIVEDWVDPDTINFD